MPELLSELLKEVPSFRIQAPLWSINSGQGRFSAITEWWMTRDTRLRNIFFEPWNIKGEKNFSKMNSFTFLLFFDNLINEKTTKTTKGWNYKNLGNFLPFVLHCMLAFCRVLQNIWRRYWIKTSLTSFHWQKTHVLVVQKLYQEKGEIGLTTSCSCMSLRAVFSLI